MEKTSNYSVRLTDSEKKEWIKLVDQIIKEKGYTTKTEAYKYLIEIIKHTRSEMGVDTDILPLYNNITRSLTNAQSYVDSLVQTYKDFKDDEEQRANSKLISLLNKIDQLEEEKKSLEKKLDQAEDIIQTINEDLSNANHYNNDLLTVISSKDEQIKSLKENNKTLQQTIELINKKFDQ